MNAPADSASVRRANLSLALRHIAAHGPCARTEVAAGTGLVHASVTALVADLIARGLVVEAGAAASTGRGRPRRLLRLVPGRVRTTAVHVGWEQITVTTAGLTGAPGRVHRLASAAGAPFGPQEPLAEAVAAAVRAVGPPDPGVHAGPVVIALSGPVVTDGPAHAPHLAGLVTAHLAGTPCRVAVVNDARMAALAEYHALTARGGDPDGTVAYVKSDAGVAGALIVGGRAVQGGHGLAGEIGHIPVSLDGPVCLCGATGCLTTYVNPRAVLGAAGLGDLAPPRDSGGALAELDRRLRAGEPRALAVLDRAGHALGAALQSVVGLTDPDHIVLGGHLADWLPWLTPGIDARLASRRSVFPHVPLTVSAGLLGPDAALHGALTAGREQILADPSVVPKGS
ncbi:N-acetylglucosamine repressor [Streptomyces sp. enrichment culture]|uniref:ROK family transcriptional regulator n=1 Tax=Streptomyces sp. enrichment culture TaxID=1795815 RepID=UPI003F57C47E